MLDSGLDFFCSLWVVGMEILVIMVLGMLDEMCIIEVLWVGVVDVLFKISDYFDYLL